MNSVSYAHSAIHDFEPARIQEVCADVRIQNSAEAICASKDKRCDSGFDSASDDRFLGQNQHSKCDYVNLVDPRIDAVAVMNLCSDAIGRQVLLNLLFTNQNA